MEGLLMSCFEAFYPATCCLCGDSANPTGEHKIKASSLRSQFGKQAMVIVSGSGRVANAQGVKSKTLHFDAPMCAACNNERTQTADREYDLFMEAAQALAASGAEPVGALETDRYEPQAVDSATRYHNVFRYFTKLMAAHLAEVGGPRSKRLSRYALGETDDCPIVMGIDADWTYQQHAQAHGDHPYAAHGGLVVFVQQVSGDPTAFFTSLTVGAVRCTITYRLQDGELVDLEAHHPAFWGWCRERGREAAASPIAHEKLLQLGLAEDRS